MDQRLLEITKISAKGLKKVKHLSKMDVYVTATISGNGNGNDSGEQITPVDKDGGSSPKWNHCMKFTIDETLAQTNNLLITFNIKCKRTIRGDKEIGEVHVPVKELLDKASDSKSAKYVTYPVKKSSGKPKGELNFLFQFGGKNSTSAIATAYPVHAALASTMYHPPQTPVVPAYPPVGYQPPVQSGGYGDHPGLSGYHAQLPQPPAGYPPLGPGYVYPAVVQPENKNDQLGGMEIGAAFLGGVLGALLVEDLSTDAANNDEAGAYDAGESWMLN